MSQAINEVEPLDRVRAAMTELFRAFCQGMNRELPVAEFQQKGLQLIRQQSWHGKLPDLVGGLIYYLKDQIFEHDERYGYMDEEEQGPYPLFLDETITFSILAQLLGGSRDGIEAVYRDLLQVETHCTSNWDQIKTHLLAEARRVLPLPKRETPGRHNRAAVLYDVLISLNRNCSIAFEEFNPLFIRWLYDHPLWDRDWRRLYLYLEAYVETLRGEHWLVHSYRRHLEFQLEELEAPARNQITRKVLGFVRKLRRGAVSQAIYLIDPALTLGDVCRVFELLERYSNGYRLEIPPWKEADLRFYQDHQPLFTQIFATLARQRLSYRGAQFEWTSYQDVSYKHVYRGGRKRIERTIWHYCPPEASSRPLIFTVYYTHSRQIQGTPQEQAEADLIRAQFSPARRYQLINPARFNWGQLGITEGPKKMAYCLAYIGDHADFLLFSEFQDYIGKGVFQEVQTAKLKGIPVFLLRNQELWLNPRLAICNEADWTLKFAKVSELPHPPLQNLSELIQLDFLE